MDGKAATGDAFALPVHARIFHGARSEILHDRANSLFAPEPVEEGKFSFHLRGAISGVGCGACGIPLGGLFRALLTGTFARTRELLLFGHSLAGALVSLAAA